MTAPTAIKVVFDKERKLKARHRPIRNAVIQSGKSVEQLLADPFGGHAYLLAALLQPATEGLEAITIDRASDLIDKFVDRGGSVEWLAEQMAMLVKNYLSIEKTPTQEETENPNAPSPAASGD
jgi:hypothetical protein